MYAITLNDESRIVSATYERYAPNGSVIVEELPEGDPTEYLYKNGVYVHEPRDTTVPDILAEIADLKVKLKATDYQAIKYAEGWITEEEYAETKAERQSYRNRINELEALLQDTGGAYE